jgi:hypothetical protein
MDSSNSNTPQPEPNATDNASAARQRRKRTFPVTFRVAKDENGRTVETKMYYAHEWEELQAREAAEERARKDAEDAARAVRDIERAAGRPAPESLDNSVPQVSLDVPRGFGPHAGLASFASQLMRSGSDVPPPDLARHSRLCSICSHPDRDAIEADFLHWRRPEQIAEDYNLSNFFPVYRHARAVGLVRRRKAEVCRVMERYLEKVDNYSVAEFDQVTRAVRVYSHLNDDGRWFDPPRTNYNYNFVGYLGPENPAGPAPVYVMPPPAKRAKISRGKPPKKRKLR